MMSGCPLYPRKRTSERSREMSALGHKQTHALQQTAALFDHLVGTHEKIRRYFEPEGTGGSQVNH